MIKIKLGIYFVDIKIEILRKINKINNIIILNKL